jgi:predicted phage terminase large subunit-like protein
MNIPAPLQPTSLITVRSQYPQVLRSLLKLSEWEQSQHIRNLGKTDLFFLLRYLLKAEYADNDWCFSRCREVQANPNGYLDLWAREHFKSTIITYALTIQDILNDPEITVGIFSHTRPIAKGFLRQIKREFEANEDLKRYYPDVLWQNPAKEAPKWSEDDGIIVKRKTNPKEATVEASGLVDGQPTSKHYKLAVYDDTVTRESVTTPDMIKKVTEAWELSLNLHSEGGASRYIGTRYHYNDSYATMMQRGSVKPRIYAATTNGKVDGTPVLLPPERLAEKRRDMGPYTFGCQMLQDPTADATQGFKEEWLRYYSAPIKGEGMRKIILCDPANEKKATSDYTSVWVLGLNYDRKIYILDMVRDRLNLTERTNLLFSLHQRWQPEQVGYERYGMQSDIAHIKTEMERRVYHFEIIELGGSMPKNDRIRRLIPKFEQNLVILPNRMFRTNYEGKSEDLVTIFIDEEFKSFPVAAHDDMLDALARMEDADIRLDFPQYYEDEDTFRREDDSRSATTGY